MLGKRSIQIEGIGERIVKAARLAVALDLFDASRQAVERFGRSSGQNDVGLRIRIDLAGPAFEGADAEARR